MGYHHHNQRSYCQNIPQSNTWVLLFSHRICRTSMACTFLFLRSTNRDGFELMCDFSGDCNFPVNRVLKSPGCMHMQFLFALTTCLFLVMWNYLFISRSLFIYYIFHIIPKPACEPYALWQESCRPMLNRLVRPDILCLEPACMHGTKHRWTHGLSSGPLAHLAPLPTQCPLPWCVDLPRLELEIFIQRNTHLHVPGCQSWGLIENSHCCIFGIDQWRFFERTYNISFDVIYIDWSKKLGHVETQETAASPRLTEQSPAKSSRWSRALEGVNSRKPNPKIMFTKSATTLLQVKPCRILELLWHMSKLLWYCFDLILQFWVRWNLNTNLLNSNTLPEPLIEPRGCRSSHDPEARNDATPLRFAVAHSASRLEIGAVCNRLLGNHSLWRNLLSHW